MKRRIRTDRIISIVFILILLHFLLPLRTADAATLMAPGSYKAGTSGYNSLKVSWSGVSGASGYSLYRAFAKSGSYKLITATKSRSYKDTGLITGNTYYYKVRSYKITNGKKTYSKYTKVVSARVIPSAPSSLKAASVSYNSISLSWGGVTGANGYSVYQASSATGTYSLLAKVKSKGYKCSGLITGKTYYYKLRAYRTVGSGIVYGNYTSVVKSKPVLAVPTTVKAALNSADSINLYWGKVTGASGYQVYRAESAHQEYSLIKTMNTTSYKNTGLEIGFYYSYKVRAYRMVGNSRVYGGFSSAVGEKTGEIHVASVSLNQTQKILAVGDTFSLALEISPENAVNKNVLWKSSDEAIATVDHDGNVIATGIGTANISAIAEDGNKTALCTVTVNNGEAVDKVEIKGIDVSKWQGKIHWEAVKNDDIQFVMMRATYGSSNVDPMFEDNYEGAKANGVAVGVYHYSYATTAAKALTEVKFLISKIKGKQFEYPVCIDIEDSSQSSLSKDSLNDIIFTYIDQLKNAGYYPMIYTNKSWFVSKLNDTKLSNIDHWLAEWGSSISYTGKVGIWQYSSSGTISGISAKVDMDISYIDYSSTIKSLHLNGY